VSLTYDADAPVSAEPWLAADPAQRRAAVELAHGERVDALHPASLHRSMHVGLHTTVETLAAQGEPHVAATLVRIMDQGVRRHAAVHMVMEVLAKRMSALTGADPWDDRRWRAALDAVDPADWIGRRMARDLLPGPSPLDR